MYIDGAVREAVAEVIERGDGEVYLCHAVPGFHVGWDALGLRGSLCSHVEDHDGEQVRRLRAWMVRYGDSLNLYGTRQDHAAGVAWALLRGTSVTGVALSSRLRRACVGATGVYNAAR